MTDEVVAVAMTKEQALDVRIAIRERLRSLEASLEETEPRMRSFVTGEIANLHRALKAIARAF